MNSNELLLASRKTPLSRNCLRKFLYVLCRLGLSCLRAVDPAFTTNWPE